MFILGVNTGRTRDGRLLKDGAACLLADGQIVAAIAEERLTRQKHAGGFTHSLPYCLSSGNLEVNDLDMVVVSTCAEESLEDGCDIGLPVSRTKVRSIPSHHLSHAYAAFLPSPFDEAVVMILDNEGNILEPRKDPIYWNNRVERNSYYLGRGDQIEPLTSADDHLDVAEIGPGEAYRHFTYFLGWHSYVYAGNTMGLAPYGQIDTFEGLEVFRLESGRIRSLLKNGRENPAQAVVEWGRHQGVFLGPPRSPHDPITPRHCDLAALIQHELERALIYKAEALHRLTGVRNLCLGGGVALNYVANRKILDNTSFERIYICPAPGDSGQCLGNVLYGWTSILGRPRRQLAPLSPYLGRSYSADDVLSSIHSISDRLTAVKTSNIAEDAARLLADGHVIGWFQGGSELGPRALGGRSILADPRQPAMKDYLNLIVKRRDPFRPFGPSILNGSLAEFYDLTHPSPYMELTASADSAVRKVIPAVTHVDGSSRPQTIATNENALYVRLLETFRSLTGLPLILNTSFNLAGEPIVESPIDALKCFLRSDLDAVVIDDFIVRRSSEAVLPRFFTWSGSG